jgi:D-alanyl-D-alanine dipeptidase
MNLSRQALENAALHPDYVDLTDLENVIVDLRYSGTNNLLSRPVYGGYQRVLLHKQAAEMFHLASRLLKEHYPQFRFIVFDALRPQTAQVEFWNLVKGTPQQSYFADPAKGSLHSYGFAIDLGLVDASGAELDMGTPFDDLTPLAEPQKEEAFLASGELKPNQIANRKVLREVMEGGGFMQLPHEWWHYDALPAAEVRANFRRVE